jgi:hypothetical protein
MNKAKAVEVVEKELTVANVNKFETADFAYIMQRHF